MKRLFVIDPVCAQELGHNLAAMKYFIGHARGMNRFDEVTGYCAEVLPPAALDGEAIEPFFGFNYHHLFDIPVSPGDEFHYACSDTDLARQSKEDFLRLLVRAGCAAQDLLFLPSADYYGIIGLMQALRTLEPAAAPRVALRMISVLDFASRNSQGARERVFEEITRTLAAGFRLEISAETPAHAAELAAALDVVVHVSPYPVIGRHSPLAPEAPPLVASLGSGRYDKGFLRLAPIFRQVLERDEARPYGFVVQNLPSRQAWPQSAYTGGLTALPGVRLLGDVLPGEVLARHLEASRIVLMPYAQDVYATRGSAMLMEALSVGRPVIASAGCGFSAQVGYYDCGALCRTNEEFAEAIVHYAAMETDELNRRMRQARARFVADSDAAYERIFS